MRAPSAFRFLTVRSAGASEAKDDLDSRQPARLLLIDHLISSVPGGKNVTGRVEHTRANDSSVI